MPISAERLAERLGAKIDHHPSGQKDTVRASKFMVDIEQVTPVMQVAVVFGHSEENGKIEVHRISLLNGTDTDIPENNPTKVWLRDSYGASTTIHLRTGEVRVLSPKATPAAYGSAR